MENLTRKAQLQEVELERTTKQLKEAIAYAGEETAKCKAAKEVIKSLTAQVRWMFMRISMIIFGLFWVTISIKSTICSANREEMFSFQFQYILIT